MKIERFEDVKAWQVARELTKLAVCRRETLFNQPRRWYNGKHG